MNKVLVTEEEKEALDWLLKVCKQNKAEAVEEFIEMRYEWEESNDKDYIALSKMETDRFIRAIYFGYEQEN